MLLCCAQLEALSLNPDLVVLSPLSRASEMGKAYLKRRPELDAVTETWDSSHEMAFGDWDNVMVRCAFYCSLGGCHHSRPTL